MGNDIEITVRVSNQTAGGLTSVSTSLHTLRQRSESAARSMRDLAKDTSSAERALTRLRAVATDIRITARIDDQTGEGAAAVKTAVRDLKRLSPIRITATFNGPATQLAAAATAMRDLRSNSRASAQSLTALAARAMAAATALTLLEQRTEAASRALRTLRGRAAAAAAAMNDLRDRAAAVSTALRTLNTRTQTADGRLSGLSDRTRTLRGDMDDLDGSLRRVVPSMNGLRGSLGTLRTSSGNAHGGMQRLKMAALALSPALVPIGAAALSMGGEFVAGLGAAAVAVGVFGLAIGRQVAAMSKAAAAEKAYSDAVKEHGSAGSKEAAEAARKLQVALADMPKATQGAAAGLMVFKETYKSWSDSVSDSTMPVVTKTFAAFGALLPRLTPLVRGTSTELDRMMTVIAGGIQSEGFERFMASFAEFAAGALSKATTGLVKFFRALDTGEVGRELSEFMAYAREVGPAVGETLGNLVKAMVHLVAGASDLGVSVLGAVNALTELVNAIPTSVLSNMLQLYVTLKLVSVGVAALGAVTGGAAVARLAAYFAVMRAAGVGTTLRATAASMTAMTKATIGLGVLAVAAIGISTLADKARGAPPDVDRLTTSLKNLAMTGQFSGELKATFGDVDGLVEKYRQLGDTAKEQEEYVKSFGSSGIKPLDDLRRSANDLWQDLTKGEDSRKALTADFDAMDESLAGLVGSGHAEQAAKDFGLIRRALRGEGESDADIDKTFDAYKAALADLKAEQEIAARGMGIFGDQALKTQAKLDAQRQSADGLRASILALNDVNRSAYDAQIAFEGSIDALTASFKENGASLDLDTEAGRKNATAMSGAAKAHDEMVAAGLAAGESLGAMTSKSDTLRAEMMRLATAFYDNKQEATAYVNTLLGTPGEIKTMVKLEREEAISGLKTVQAAIKKTPSAKSIKVDTLNAAAIKALEAVGLKTRNLPDGRTEVFTKNGKSLGPIGAVLRALNNLDGRTANTYTTHTITYHKRTTYDKDASGVPDYIQAPKGATGGLYTGSSFRRGYATGGLVEGPGTETSDDVLAPWLSKNEFVVNARSARKHMRLLRAINEDRVEEVGLAKGGKLSKQQKAEREARTGAQGDLTISHFGKMAGYKRSEFGTALSNPDSIGSLVNALNQWRGIIMKATSGRTEKNLLRQLDSTGKALLKQERALSKVTAELDKAKTKLSELKSAASQLASSVKNNILGSANITRGASGEGRVTTASIMGGLTSSRDKATAFAQALKDLQKKGLSKDLLTQVAEAGIDGGGLETATALLGASSSEIKSMNDLQAQITKAATSAGKTTADAVYKAQIKAQERTVKALKSVQEKLTASMDKLTKAMEKAIEKAFGTKATGGIVGAAASGGVRGGWTLTGEQGPELIRIPVGSRVYPAGQSRRMAWDSMLTTGGGQATSRPLARPAAGGAVQPIVVHQTITLDGKVVARAIFDPMRDEVLRRTGGDVQKALGRN